MLAGVLNHLWQSSALAAVVFVATAILRRHSPRLRYWLWFAASAKFLIPFSLLFAAGAQVQIPQGSHPLHATTVTKISTVFAPMAGGTVAVHSTKPIPWGFFLGPIWLAGVICLLFRWLRHWRRIRRAALAASPLPIQCPIPVLSSSSFIEPGVFGIVRPVLLLPGSVSERLTPQQFDAIVTHELRHWRCRDNLTAAFHMFVEAIFWFHPLVWWIGARLIEERERDCDEAVLIQGGRARDYAEGILVVCRYYVDSPLTCMSGISGADLKRRIRQIMEWQTSLMFTRFGKTVLAAAAVIVFSIPFVIGVLRAQALPPAPAYTYAVVSIRPSPAGQTDAHFGPGPEGGVQTENSSPMELLTFAYEARSYQFVDVPSWVWSERYDVSFTPDKPENVPGGAYLGAVPGSGEEMHILGKPREADAFFLSRSRQRMQAVLRDRFGLLLRAENRTMPIYSLKRNRNGDKLSIADPTLTPRFVAFDGWMYATAVSMREFAVFLSSTLDRPVTDETGLSSSYNVHLSSPDIYYPPGVDNPKPPATRRPSIFTALSEQLGLRLEATKGTVPVYVIERIVRPSRN